MNFLFVLLFLVPWGRGTIRFGKTVQVNDPDSAHTKQDHPAVVIDNNLRVFVAWQDDRDQDGKYEIYFSYSSDTGKTFSQDLNISNSPNINDKYPVMAVFGDSIYVIWQGTQNGTSWKVYYTYSHDGGRSFAPADTLPGVTVRNSTTSSVNDGPQPDIAGVITNDTLFLYVIWVDDGTGVLRIKLARSVNEGPFQDLGIVDNNPGRVNRDLSIAVDDKGNLLIAYRYGTGGTNQDPHPWIAFNKSTDRGETFNYLHIVLDDTISQNFYTGNPQITYAAEDSTIIITWEDCRRHGGNTNPDIFFTRSKDGGITFDSVNLRVNWVEDTSLMYDNYRAQIAMSPDGKMAVVWHSDPEMDGHYSLYMCAYSDSMGKFGLSVPVPFDTLESFTGTTPGTFGNNFYPAGIKVANIDGTTNFFMVWEDLNYDINGNIYFVRGQVVISQVDLDIFDDSLDVHSGIVDFDSLPAGPAYVSRHIMLVNTDSLYNPDTLDGPSTSVITSLRLVSATLVNGQDTLTTLFAEKVPDSLLKGEKAEVMLTLFIPEGSLKGTYQGYAVFEATGADSTVDYDSVLVIVHGPYPEENLDSLKVFPNPFRADKGHDRISFEGLTENAEVSVYDMHGRLVFHKVEENADGLITWYPVDVASGIYMYVVKNNQGEIKRGKIAIIK